MDYVVQLSDDENTIEMKKNILSTIKELENLYSWSQFYQIRKQRISVGKAQNERYERNRKSFKEKDRIRN